MHVQPWECRPEHGADDGSTAGVLIGAARRLRPDREPYHGDERGVPCRSRPPRRRYVPLIRIPVPAGARKIMGTQRAGIFIKTESWPTPRGGVMEAAAPKSSNCTSGGVRTRRATPRNSSHPGPRCRQESREAPSRREPRNETRWPDARTCSEMLGRSWMDRRSIVPPQ